MPFILVGCKVSNLEFVSLSFNTSIVFIVIKEIKTNILVSFLNVVYKQIKDEGEVIIIFAILKFSVIKV